MTTDELLSALRQVLTLAAGIMTGAGWISHDQATSIIGDVMVIVPAVISLASVAWSIYAHWNMKKVPENARVVMTAPAKAVLLLLALGAAVATAPAPAHAGAVAPKTATPLPCDPLNLLPGCQGLTADVSSTGDLWQKLIAAAAPDLAYAKALADAAGTPGSKLRAQCLAAIIAANSQANGVGLKNPDGSPLAPPNPALITKLEQAAELVDNLQPDAPVVANCAAAANAAKVSVLQFLSTLLAGVAVKAGTAGVLP